MNETQQLKNVLAFLSILFGEKPFIQEIMDMNPEYIIEKFNRYIESTRSESPWGLHPCLRTCIFDSYLIKWGIDKEQYDE